MGRLFRTAVILCITTFQFFYFFIFLRVGSMSLEISGIFLHIKLFLAHILGCVFFKTPYSNNTDTVF